RDILSGSRGGATTTPSVALSQGAAQVLERALAQPDQCIRLVITDEFEHQLSVDTPQPNDTKLMLGRIPLLLDTESLGRADGLAIDWIETSEGRGFRIDNPNRPEPVHQVDRAWLASETRPLGLFVIDVRTHSEYCNGHFEGARLLDATLIDALEKLDRRTPLLFYCNGGIRSRKAADYYRALGFSEVYCLTQGPG
ncbi:MAG TPA: rhodanese-like domain-containing protein, partial [Polyangiaceae bacterium]|nr:rhodanese-like domain-containing protein [Polyangiaceae bacterium]